MNYFNKESKTYLIFFSFAGGGGLDVLGLTALWGSISVYIGPSPKEREKEERKER